MIVAVVAGLAIGALVGLLGGGGSILAVPALVYAAGQDLPQAVATSLLVVGITSLVALLPRLRAGQIAWRIAVLFGAAGAATAFAGAAVNRLLPDDVVLALFAALMIGANSAAGFAAHAGGATLDVPVTVAFTGAAVLTALAAGRLGSRVDTTRLRRWFAYLVFTVAAGILVQIGAGLLG